MRAQVVAGAAADLAGAAADLAGAAADLAGAGDDLVEAAVSREPLHRRLRPHLRDARDIVRAVADEGEVVDDALGRDAEFGDDAVAGTVSVPITSSASTPSTTRHGRPLARTPSCSGSICATRSSGMGGRCALYCSNKSSRKVLPLASNTTATYSGS